MWCRWGGHVLASDCFGLCFRWAARVDGAVEVVIAVHAVMGNVGAVAPLSAVVCRAFMFLGGVGLTADSTGVGRVFAHGRGVSQLVAFATLGSRAVCVVCVDAALLVANH